MPMTCPRPQDVAVPAFPEYPQIEEPQPQQEAPQNPSIFAGAAPMGGFGMNPMAAAGFPAAFQMPFGQMAPRMTLERAPRKTIARQPGVGFGTGFGTAPRPMPVGNAFGARPKKLPTRRERLNEGHEEAEECEEHEEQEVAPQQNMEVRPMAPEFELRYCSFVSQGVWYSLTKRRVQRPRVDLIRQGEYFVAKGALYQAISTIPLPKIQPGYSVDQLMVNEVKAFRFNVVYKAQTPTQRTRYGPEITPDAILVRDIQNFVDVYEPTGCDVAQQGVILSDQARQEIGQLQRKCRIIPKSHHVRLPNRVTLAGEQFVEAFADISLAKQVDPIECDTTLNIEQIETHLCQIVVSQPEEAVVDKFFKFANQFDPTRTSQLMTQLSERYPLRKLYEKQENKFNFIRRLKRVLNRVASNANIATNASTQQFINSFFQSEASITPICQLLAMTPDFTQAQMLQVYKEEMTDALYRQQVAKWYTGAFAIAMGYKNTRFINFLLNELHLPPTVFGQFGQIALNAKLQEKDIKVGMTISKLNSPAVHPLSLAGYAGSRGFVQLVQKCVSNATLNLSAEQQMQITIGCCANLKDDLDLVKQVEKLVGRFNPELAVSTALLAQNRRILSYVSTKYNMQGVSSVSFSRFLNPEHYDLLKTQLVLSPAVVTSLSASLDDELLEQLFRRLLGQTANGTSQLHLYNDAIMSQLILFQKPKLIELFLGWGYSFAKASERYGVIVSVLDTKFFSQILGLIVKHFRQAQKSPVEVWAQLIEGAVAMHDVARVSLIQAHFEKAVTLEEMRQHAPCLLQSFLKYYTRSASVDCISMARFAEISRALKFNLICAATAQQFSDVNFGEPVPLIDITDDCSAVLEGLNLNYEWVLAFTNELLVKLAAEFAGSAAVVSSVSAFLRNAFSLLERMSLNGSGGFRGSARCQIMPYQQSTNGAAQPDKKLVLLEENLKTICASKALLRAATDDTHQFIQNQVALFVACMALETMRVFFSNSSLELKTAVLIEKKAEAQEAANLDSAVAAKLQKLDLTEESRRIDIILSNPQQLEQYRQPQILKQIEIHDKTFLHFMTCRSSVQFKEIMKHVGGAVCETVDSCGNSPLNFIFKAWAMQVLSGAFVVDNVVYKVQAIVDAIKTIEQQASAFQAFVGVFQTFTNQDLRLKFVELLLATFSSQEVSKLWAQHMPDGKTILHVLVELMSRERQQFKYQVFQTIFKKLEELSLVEDLIKQVDSYGEIAAMGYSALAGEIVEFQIQMIPKGCAVQSVEGNNFLHYLLQPSQRTDCESGFGFGRSRSSGTSVDEIFQLVIAALGEEETRTLMSQPNKYGTTPLHFACGSKSTLDLALGLNCDIHAINAAFSLYYGAKSTTIGTLAIKGVDFFVNFVENDGALVVPSQLVDSIRRCEASGMTVQSLLEKLIANTANKELATRFLLQSMFAESYAIVMKMDVAPSLPIAAALMRAIWQAYNQDPSPYVALATKFKLAEFVNKLEIDQFGCNHSSHTPRILQQLPGVDDSPLFEKLIRKVSMHNRREFLLGTIDIMNAKVFAMVLRSVQHWNNVSQSDIQDFIMAGVQRHGLTDDILKALVTLYVSKSATGVQRKMGMHGPGMFGQIAQQVNTNFVRQLLDQNAGKLTKQQLQEAVDDVCVPREQDVELAEFLKRNGLTAPKPIKAPALPKTAVFTAAAEDVALLEKYYKTVCVPSTKLENKLFSSRKDHRLSQICYKDSPCSVVGLRRCGTKLGVMVIRLVEQRNQFFVLQGFNNIQSHTGAVELEQCFNRIEYHFSKMLNRYTQRSKLTAFSDAFTAFQEFQKRIAAKSEQTFEQIVAEHDTLGCQPSAKKFQLYLYDPEQTSIDTAVVQLQNVQLIQRTHLGKIIQFISNGTYASAIEYVRFRAVFADLGNLTLHQLQNLLFYVTSYRLVVLENSEQEHRRILRQVESVIIASAKLCNKVLSPDFTALTKETVDELLRAFGFESEPVELLGRKGLHFTQILEPIGYAPKKTVFGFSFNLYPDMQATGEVVYLQRYAPATQFDGTGSLQTIYTISNDKLIAKSSGNLAAHLSNQQLIYLYLK